MNGGTLWTVTVKTIITGQESNPFLNVFTYGAVESDVVGANALLVNWVPDILAAWVECIHSSAYIASITIYNLFDLGDFTIQTFTPTQYPGLIGSEIMPRFNAASFVLQTTNRDVRNGSKRISPLAEVQVQSGSIVGAFATSMQALADQWLIIIPAGGGEDMFPCIVKRVKITNIQTGEVTYELPDTPQEAIWYPISDATLKPVVTSQNTRKR